VKLERRTDEPVGPERLQRRSSSGRQTPGWEQQEARTERVLGGKRVKGSGCSTRRSHKSDVSAGLWRVEDKTTGGKTLAVERGWLEKIAGEAQDNRQRPALQLGFDEDAEHSVREDWLAFPMLDAARMMQIVEKVLAKDYGEAKALAELLRRV
jgi:hypothetical protein